jgi:hypothetical protein
VRNNWSGCLAAITVACAPTLGAQAADSAATRFDIGVGITMTTPKDVNQRPQCDELGLPCQSGRTFPDFGLAVQAAVTVLPHLALVTEASSYTNRWDTVAVNPVDEGRQNHVRALMAGPRVMTGLYHGTSLSDRTSPSRFNTLGTIGYRAFAQVLVGREASDVAPTRFAIQPGAGVDVRLSYPDTWFRVTGDYRATRGGPRNLSTARAIVALVVAS